MPGAGVGGVFTTRLKSALEATGEGGNVKISVTTTADRLSFAVRDNGCGMDEATQARAGEPFFTTKPPDAGSGLGLFLARTFVEQWGGQFVLSSPPPPPTLAAPSFPTHPQP